jgi:hypothetical protein
MTLRNVTDRDATATISSMLLDIVIDASQAQLMILEVLLVSNSLALTKGNTLSITIASNVPITSYKKGVIPHSAQE